MDRKYISIIIILIGISLSGGFFLGKKTSVKELNYFVDAKLQRNQQTDMTLQLLKALIDNKNVDDEEKKKAADAYTNLAVQADIQTKLELQFKGVGFKDSICFIDGNKIRIIIKLKKELTEDQIKQIKEIVSRYSDIKDIEINTRK